MLAFMAGLTMNIGPQVAYLQVFIMPYLLQFLRQATYLTDPMLQKMTYHVFVCGSPWWWPLQGRRTHAIPKRLCGKKKPSVPFWMKMTNSKSKLRTYLVPIAVSIFKVGCRVEGWTREIFAARHLRKLPSISRPTFPALSSAVNCTTQSALNPTPTPSGSTPMPHAAW